MNITTLLAYWIDQKNQADKELSDARVKLTLSQTELATQRANLTKANQELAALVTQNKKNHADMAEANPADVHALELELAKTITDTRTKQAEIIEIEAAVDTAQNALVLANATVNTATSRASTVASSLDADDQDKDRVKIGDKQAVRTTSIVKISNVAGHPFLVNDVITVMDMADFSFNGTFTINLVTDTSISYLQIKTLTIGRGKAARTANSVTISGLSGHTFKNNDTIGVTGMTDASFNGKFTITAVTGDSITYPQTLPDATTGGGVIQAALAVGIGSEKAVRAANSVTITELDGHSFKINDTIVVKGMKDPSFDGMFIIGAITPKSITYPQAKPDATSGDGAIQVVVTVASGKAIRAAGSVTISELTGHSFKDNDTIAVTGMTDPSFNGIFTIGAITGDSITYLQSSPDATSAGGAIQAAVAVGSGKAVRTANSVTISGLSGHTFKNNDTIVVTGMADAIFNGTFKIGAIAGDSITYPQTQPDASSGGGAIQAAVAVGSGKAVRTANSVTISKLTGHSFKSNDAIVVTGMTDARFDGIFTILDVTGDSITYPQTQHDATSGGGAIQAAVDIGNGKAVRTAGSVTISKLVGHAFRNNDTIVVTGMIDASFNGIFKIGAITGDSITYLQTLPDSNSGGGVIQIADATSGGGIVYGKRAMRLRQKLKTSPLSTLVTEASTALVAKPWTDAVKRINEDFPKELLDCAVIRAEVEHKRLDNDKKNADEIVKQLGSEIDKTENLREKFKNVDADFRDYVFNAKRNFDQAMAIATRIADHNMNPLTVAERARIHDLTDFRKQAATARMKIAEAQKRVDEKQAAVELAELNAKAAGNDPKTDPVVDAANNALKTEKILLADKKNAFTPLMQTNLTDWEITVPDTAWHNLADFKESKRLFDDLKNDPAQLVTAMDEIESDLVAALQEADKKRKKIELLKEAAQQANLKLSFDAGILQRRLFSVLRGDDS